MLRITFVVITPPCVNQAWCYTHVLSVRELFCVCGCYSVFMSQSTVTTRGPTSQPKHIAFIKLLLLQGPLWEVCSGTAVCRCLVRGEKIYIFSLSCVHLPVFSRLDSGSSTHFINSTFWDFKQVIDSARCAHCESSGFTCSAWLVCYVWEVPYAFAHHPTTSP